MRLRLISTTSLVVASMIGAGVFTTSGFALADLQSRWLVMLAWAIGALIAIAGALSYGGLARAITESGGEYLYLARVVHPAVGFLAGWVSLLAGFTGAIAFAARTFETYAIPAEQLPSWLPTGSLAILVVLVVGSLHYLGAHLGVLTQNSIVFVKLIALISFLIWSCWLGVAEGWPGVAAETSVPSPAGLSTLLASLVWISLSYSGFNAAIYVTDEVVDPERTVPRSMWLAVVLVACFYLGLNAVFLWGPVYEESVGSPDIGAVAARAIGGPLLEKGMRAVIAISLLTSVSAMLIAGPRVYAKMASDQLFPHFFTHPKRALILQIVLATLVILAAGLREMLGYLGLTLSLSTAAAVSTLFVLHYRGQKVNDWVVGYPLIPLFYVAATLLLATVSAWHRPWEMAATIATFATGGIAFFVFRQSA